MPDDPNAPSAADSGTPVEPPSESTPPPPPAQAPAQAVGPSAPAAQAGDVVLGVGATCCGAPQDCTIKCPSKE